MRNALLPGFGRFLHILFSIASCGHRQLTGFRQNIRLRKLRRDFFCPVNHRLRHAGQTCHIDAVALVCAAPEDFPEEHDILTMIGHGDAIVFHALQLSLQLGQLMIVSSKEGLGLHCIAEILHHGPGDGQTVKGTGATADLIQDQQRPGGGIPENVGHLVHFHHKGGLPAGQVVGCAHSGENPVADGDVRLLRRYEGADGGHQGDERHLTHIGGFSRHIRTGNDGNPVFIVIQQGIVADEAVLLQKLLNHRMTAIPDDNAAFIVDFWTHILVVGGHPRKRYHAVENSNAVTALLHPVNVFTDTVPHLGKECILQCVELFLRAENDVLQLLQAICGVALSVRQGLLSDIRIRHLVLKGIADLDAVAENPVVLDLQRFNAGLFPLLCLQIR